MELYVAWAQRIVRVQALYCRRGITLHDPQAVIFNNVATLNTTLFYLKRDHRAVRHGIARASVGQLVVHQIFGDNVRDDRSNFAPGVLGRHAADSPQL